MRIALLQNTMSNAGGSYSLDSLLYGYDINFTIMHLVDAFIQSLAFKKHLIGSCIPWELNALLAQCSTSFRTACKTRWRFFPFVQAKVD